MSSAGSLGDVVVVDWSTDVGDDSDVVSALIRGLLAGAGAQVVRVGRDPDVPASRPGGHVHGESEMREAEGADREAQLAAADVVLVRNGAPSDAPAANDIGDAIAPDAVVLVIDEGSFAGPVASDAPHELIVQAVTGTVFEHMAGRPAFNGMRFGCYGAAVNAATAVVAALVERLGSGKGQRLHVSMAAGAVASMAVVWPMLGGPDAPRANVPVGANYPVFACADGQYVLVSGSPRSANSMELLRDLLELDVSDVSSLRGGRQANDGDFTNYFFNYDVLASGFARLSSVEIFNRLRDADFAAEIVRPPTEGWGLPQVERRGLIATCSCGAQHVGFPIVGV